MVTSRPQPLYPREKIAGTRWTVGWEGPKPRMDSVEKRKISFPCKDSNPRTPATIPITPSRLLCSDQLVKQTNSVWETEIRFSALILCFSITFRQSRSSNRLQLSHLVLKFPFPNGKWQMHVSTHSYLSNTWAKNVRYTTSTPPLFSCCGKRRSTRTVSPVIIVIYLFPSFSLFLSFFLSFLSLSVCLSLNS